jgi:hypothetical protein
MVLTDHGHDAAAPHVGTRAEVSEHIVRGPLVVVRGDMQASGCQTGGQLGDAPRPLCKQDQDLLDRQHLVGHVRSPFR